MALEFLLIIVLVLINGFFAALELALVTSRKHRLRSMADEGKSAATDVLQIKEKPGHYLATVQVGITLVGHLAAAFGGQSAAPDIAEAFGQVPLLAPYANQLALLTIVLAITYLSLVFGELVPKQLALRNPEALSVALARPVKWLSRIAALPIRFLSFSADLILGLLGPQAEGGPSTSAEEIELLVQQGTAEGIFQISEGAFVRGVFDYADRKAHEVMTARPEISALEASLSPREALEQAAKSGHSRFPVYEESLDSVVGYVHLKDLIWAQDDTPLRDIARQLAYIPESLHLPQIYSLLTKQRTHMAIVLDEYGGTAGLLTLEDVLEVIVGEIDDEYQPANLEIRKLGDKAWLVAGNIQLDDLSAKLNVELPSTDAYTTCAGLIMSELGHLPKVGEQIVYQGLTFTVRSMDKLRISSILVQQAIEPAKPIGSAAG
ncbi:MAG: HlyC/CorC family transporter [Anaerolineales bacterium]|nr:HlyC/CorC family transporter [Anaerolineales bacterium]